MVEDQFDEMKDEYIQYIKDFMKEYGQFGPMITVFADSPEEEKPAVIHIPVPPQFMKNEEAKDEFVNEMIPEIFADIKQKFTPYAVAWAAEAWIRKIPKDINISDTNNINHKEIPSKKEVIFVSIQQKNNQIALLFNIKRQGKQITASGDIVDQIELEQDDAINGIEGVAGRFSNLFSKFDD